MIERATSATEALIGTHCAACGEQLPTDAGEIVRAVLLAIREPSDGMQARGGRPPMPLVKLDSERARERLRAKVVWQAMIDAALAE